VISLAAIGGLLGAIPRPVMIAGAVALVLLTVVGMQRCSIASLERDLAASRKQVAELDAAYGICRGAVRDLEAANAELAQAAERQSDEIRRMAAAADEAQREADRLLAAAQKRIAEKSSAVELLARALRQPPPASTCPAGDAVKVIREALK
jgi:predicted RNase H-like nuclease (RuvC/YqgF family)